MKNTKNEKSYFEFSADVPAAELVGIGGLGESFVLLTCVGIGDVIVMAGAVGTATVAVI